MIIEGIKNTALFIAPIAKDAVAIGVVSGSLALAFSNPASAAVALGVQTATFKTLSALIGEVADRIFIKMGTLKLDEKKHEVILATGLKENLIYSSLLIPKITISYLGSNAFLRSFDMVGKGFLKLISYSLISRLALAKLGIINPYKSIFN